ncbi:YceI family protein [Timonella senegalensis]|uniref:YceI family protein n=1 Tax=Timonella senegalensis TaxID=1465825 RepID=UPI00031A3669|nr:YceI family protein [Timonella senegalensis]
MNMPAGLTAGTYTADTTHTSAGFTVRHAGISKVRGTVPVVSASIDVAENFLDSKVTAELDARGVNTGSADRDGHLQSADFFNVDVHPTWTFKSTSITASGSNEFVVNGDLTINGVTKSVPLEVEFTGTATDPFGNKRAAFEGQLEISRKEFGLVWNAALETGGVLVSDKVKINIEVSAISA